LFSGILNRLEKLEIIDNKDDWLELWKIRNDLSHNYDDNPEEMASVLSCIYGKK